MKIKDWKKVGANRWRNSNNDVVQIYKGIWKSLGERYIVAIGNLNLRHYKHRKFVKTKSAALKFAKSYMRTH